MRPPLLLIATIAVIVASHPVYAASDSTIPYAGQQSRAIKALSEADLAALRGGDGMGLAKAAELNGYPGPRHALDLARELALGETQRQQITAVRDRMSAAARALGAALIEREAALDRLFAGGEITPERLDQAMGAIGEAQARLRAAHLLAHLETRSILSPAQIAQYNTLRGYTAAEPSHHGHRH
jgi:Spy/CpxP family protein refolding chaperone